MNREQRKDIIEAFGLIAIVASLIFLAYETRQNTIAIQQESQQTILAIAHERDSWLLDSAFAKTYDTGMRDLASLSSPELLQFDTFVGQSLNVWELAFYNHQSGVMTDEVWQGWDAYFRSEVRNASWRQIWTSGKRDAYAESFQSHVDTHLTDD